MPLSSGSRLGPYEIRTPLGAGGMGEVYRARDTKLDRDVAIKVLPESVAADPDALLRFEREAKAVAALSHPNILAIFDFGTHEGVSYAVTELLEGETLRARLDAGPIPQKTAVDYAVQIAKGLAAAHERGVVHRDLKPENLFVTRDGHVKILDFGLAKREPVVARGEETSAPTISSRTEPGTVMGTLGYMSPEQVRGLPVDARSDIFSFGSILYELLSGQKAFKKDTPADTTAAIIKEEPPKLSASGRRISPALDRIVKHCLEKRAEQRFQSARDVVFSLLAQPSALAMSGSLAAATPPGRTRGAWPWLAGGVVAIVVIIALSLAWRLVTTRDSSAVKTAAAGAKRPRLVVLPFENLGAPEDAYFAAGMTEEISSRLANLQGLSVISRTTAVGYDRKGKSIRQIGSDLGVDYVLEGTIQWERASGRESRLRITPELIQVADDTHLWGDRYDRVMADIFAVQSEVAENVVRSLGMKLVPRERSALVTASTNNIEAYDFYLRGLALAGQSHGLADQTGAVKLFQQAVDGDPKFFPAQTELVKAHLSIYFYFDRFHVPPDKSHVESARKVLETLSSATGEDLPELRIARGYYTYWGLDKLEPALVDFQAALALQPSSIPALSGALFVIRRLGRWKEADEIQPKLVELDPQNPEILQQAGMTDVVLRQYADAERLYALATKFNRTWGLAWGQRALAQTLWGNPKKADQLVAEARSVDGLVDEFGWVDYSAFRAPLLQRDFSRALHQVDAMKRDVVDTQWFYVPVELMRADAYAYSKAPGQAERWYQAARRRMEGLAAKAPKDSRFHSALALAYAGLGLRSEALREATAGVDLMPPATDAWRAMYRRQDLARVHAMLGDQNAAIEGLSFLLAGNTELSAQQLHLDPRWDPLRSNPRFQSLLAKYGEKP